MKKVKALKPGSKIAIISPSSGLPHLFPEHYELGLKNLRDFFGFEVVEMPTARKSIDELYNNPELRAQDINKCFADESIDGIITTIGGYESVRILPFLDTEIILENPKFIMGFSDATTFLAYLNQLGMVTFYGPSIMAGFSQLKSLPEEYAKHLQDMIFLNKLPYTYQAFDRWTNGYKDWANQETLGECKEFYPNNSGWRYIQGEDSTEGELWGGCIEVLEFMKSTNYWPDKRFWDNRILLFETSEDKPTPAQVEDMFRNYGMQGVLNKIKGIIVARPKDYTENEKQELYENIIKVVAGEFGAHSLPIVVNVDFGHTDPKLVFPMGVKVSLDPKSNSITLLENPFIND